jgi:DNA-binding IclR family transcriptional regulator
MSFYLHETETSGGIQVIARAAAVLRALDQDGMSLGDLSKATGLPRSTVQRIVDSLARENLVELDITGIRPGWGLQELAKKANSDIAQRVRPALEQLFQTTHETVDISTASGGEVAFLDRIISDQELRVVPIPTKPRPLHLMANGKAILSLMNDEDINATIRRRAKPSSQTKTKIADILAEIATVRTTGFSYDREDHTPGVCAVGTPIHVTGLRPHAISIVVPLQRFDAHLQTYRKALMDCRTRVEKELSR